MIYPSLPARLDLGIARINGAGLGNCLYTYCHAVVLAQLTGQRLIAPAWRSIAINKVLRGNGTFRRYHRMLVPHPDEVRGGRRLAALAAGWARHRSLDVVSEIQEPSVSSRLIVFCALRFTFSGLLAHRAMLRERIVGILAAPPSRPIAWGAGGYGAVHVRLGDFTSSDVARLDEGTTANLRIPISWYVGVVADLRRKYPEKPLRIFTDGQAADVAALLAIDGVALAEPSSDIGDLLEMAQADFLVGSHSTFSYWAAFFGNMPTFWRDRKMRPDIPTDIAVPTHFVPDCRSRMTAGEAA